MIVPFYQLSGRIDLIKETEYREGKELIYKDENGDRAIIFVENYA